MAEPCGAETPMPDWAARRVCGQCGSRQVKIGVDPGRAKPYSAQRISPQTPRINRMPHLEEVFRLSGIPTYTFVEPGRYDEIMVSVRTPRRCLVLEGPSGIGKTTSITKVFADLGWSGRVLSLSARKESDLELINE